MRSTRELLVPLLKYLGDAEVHTLHSSYLYLAKNLNMSKKDLQVLMPSRVKMKKKNNRKLSTTDTGFYIRVADAIHVLRYGKLLENLPGLEKKGVFKITVSGFELLENSNTDLDVKILQIYAHWNKKKKN